MNSTLKKLLLLLSAFSMLILGGACLTTEMYQSQYKPKHFQEEISSFLITQDGKQLVFIGKSHHYIFDTTDHLKFVLTWPKNQLIRPQFEEFKIDAQQTVTGKYQLTLNITPDLSDADKALLNAHSFIEDRANQQFHLRATLIGKRYLADKFKLPAAMRFKQKLIVNMSESRSPTVVGMAGRILATPLTVAADGVILAGSPLLFLALWIDAATR